MTYPASVGRTPDYRVGGLTGGLATFRAKLVGDVTQPTSMAILRWGENMLHCCGLFSHELVQGGWVEIIYEWTYSSSQSLSLSAFEIFMQMSELHLLIRDTVARAHAPVFFNRNLFQFHNGVD